MMESKFLPFLHQTIHRILATETGCVIIFERLSTHWIVDHNHPHPFMYLRNSPLKWDTFGFSDHPLNHYVSQARLNAIDVKGDGLIVTCVTKGFGTLTLTIGCRPHHPIIQLQDESKVFYASTTHALRLDETKHFPLVVDQDQATQVLFASALKPLRIMLQQSIRSKAKKSKAYENDEEKHKHRLQYFELAEELQMMQTINCDALTVRFGSLVDYSQYTFGELLNYAYTQGKRGKKGLEMIQQQRQLNDVQLALYRTIAAQTITDDETSFHRLKQFLIQEKLLKAASQKIIEVRANSPYQITYKNWTISFGKNQHQNDYLTFQLAKKSHVFLHLDGSPSHHVIIHISTFDRDAIRFAAELLLHLNHREDGPIVYAKVGSLKQTKIPGQVIMRDVKKLMVKQSHQYPIETLLQAAIRI
jgi:hypothetical protein